MNLNTFEMDKHEQGHEMIHQLEQDVDTINREVGEMGDKACMYH